MDCSQAPLSMGFPRQEYWVGCHFLLQGIFSTQGSNSGLLPCRQILYRLSHQGSPTTTQAMSKPLCDIPCQEQRPAGASFHLAWWWGVGGTSGACELAPKNCFLLQVLTDPGRQLTTALSDVGKTLKVVPKKKKG